MSSDTLQLIESSILIASLKDDVLKLWQVVTWYSLRVNLFSFYNREYIVYLNDKIAQDFQFKDDREKSERKWVRNQSTCFFENPNKRFIQVYNVLTKYLLFLMSVNKEFNLNLVLEVISLQSNNILTTFNWKEGTKK